ncbi:MAG: ribosome small subunit-dependent GTPase A [Paracoccaceae bacterium]|nr:ribosome small subunit-dependent GTPase A [Paracoccaceae bacterium]
MTSFTLSDLGWSDHFARQTSPDGAPMRVAAVHRDSVDAIGETGPARLTLPFETGALAVGDWVRSRDGRVTDILARQTLLKRRAAGTEARDQLIAANVTTLGIVTSCNADFNAARIERYLVISSEAGCLPLVILTKADLTDDARGYLREAERLSPLLTAISLDATDPQEVERLAPWCRHGETLALVGSSGVGKTTLRNALTRVEGATQGIREDDAKGRHTTTSRELLPTIHGGWLIDTPGMRALRLTEASEGIASVFEDIEALAAECRFSDCRHETEPGCRVQAALAEGSLDPARLNRWRKLRSEEARNSESIAEARARDKGFGKMVRGVMEQKRRERGG